VHNDIFGGWQVLEMGSCIAGNGVRVKSWDPKAYVYICRT
jgi:hypothetical protein